MTLKLPCGTRREHHHTFTWAGSNGGGATIRARHEVVEFWVQFAFHHASASPGLALDGVPVDDKALRDNGWHPLAFLQYHRDAGNALAGTLLGQLEEQWTKW